jgi:V8-like Glu-specific endopeptidase
MMATGWLNRNDLVVTAGHVACDWDHKLGLLRDFKCYIGYHGRDRVKDPNVQFRHGISVASPAEWLKGPNSAYDVSFIKLEKPFTGIKPFRFVDTPIRGSLTLGVVGYPGDLTDGGTRGGEHMHEMFLPVTFDLATSKKKMLSYKIDTFGGNSGSPVLNKSGMEAIGVHVLGGTTNSASVIGPLGNNFKSFVASFTRKPESTAEGPSGKAIKAKNFRIVSVRSIDSSADPYYTCGTEGPNGGPVRGNDAASGID